MEANILNENLWHSVEMDNVKALKLALRMGADVNARFQHGYTALHHAVERLSMKALKYLCGADYVDIDPLSDFMMTPLAIAVSNDKKEIVKILLDFGADPNLVIAFDQTAVHLAAYHRNDAILLDLISNGGEVNVIDCFDQSPLFISILLSPDRRITRILIEAGADPSIKSKIKLPLLTEAILAINIFQHYKVIKTLIDYGANVNESDEIKQETPLHKAATVGHARLIYYLIEKGAELQPVNVYGQTPLDLARMHGNEDIVEILLSMENDMIEEELVALEANRGRKIV